MPWLEAAIGDLNRQINDAMRSGEMAQRQKLANYFSPDAAMRDLFIDVGLNPQRRSLEALEGWPEGVTQATRAAIRAGLTDENVGNITVVWTAGYDFSVTVSQSTPFDGSPAGLVVHIQTRYPFDPHPARGPARGA